MFTGQYSPWAHLIRGKGNPDCVPNSSQKRSTQFFKIKSQLNIGILILYWNLASKIISDD